MFEMPAQLDPTKNIIKSDKSFGLVIVDNIVSAFNGNISFTSREGFGSTFVFSFKLVNETTELLVGS